MIEVGEFTNAFAATTDPKLTVVDEATKLDPVIITSGVKPPVGPELGVTELTVGAA